MQEDKEFSLLRIEGLTMEYRYATTGMGFVISLTYLDDLFCKEKILDEKTPLIPISFRPSTRSSKHDIAGKVEFLAGTEGAQGFLALTLTQPQAVKIELFPARTVLLVPPESPQEEGDPQEYDEFEEPPESDDMEAIMNEEGEQEKTASKKRKA